VRRHFQARTHQNALRDPQLPPDAKTQVRHNVSRRGFCVICTGPTRVQKIVRRCFTPRRHRNALRDPQKPPDAKTQVQRNVSQPGLTKPVEFSEIHRNAVESVRNKFVNLPVLLFMNSKF
jgi:hypothetical protein